MMALQILNNSEYNRDEDSEDPFAEELFGEEYEKLFRPSLADRLQVGFLRSDKCTQTIDSEIIEIKTMTKTVSSLVEEMSELKRDLHFSKQVITAKYNQDLDNTAHTLQTKLQEKLQDMERLHEERVNVVRRSFKQQLTDALVKMSKYYRKFYEDKLGTQMPATPSGGGKKLAALQAEAQRNRSIIQMMEIQIEELQNELAAKPEETEIKIDTSELDAMQEQNETLQEEITTLNNRIDDLNDSIEFREENIRNLTSDLDEEKLATEKEREMTRKLAKKIEALKQEFEKENSKWKNEVDKVKNSMQDSLEEEMKKQSGAQQNLLVEQEKALKEAELEQEKKLAEERRKFEAVIAKERALAEKLKREAQDSKSVERVLQQQQNEIQVLRQRLHKTQKQWERKFAILRSSLHALKDESYIRQQLQKQSASLKYASISYGGEMPPVQSTVPPVSGKIRGNKPLPAIQHSAGRKQMTNTLPSGPGTDLFTTGFVDSGDEQEMEDCDEFVPLPNPPRNKNIPDDVKWRKQQFGEYMPSLEGSIQ